MAVHIALSAQVDALLREEAARAGKDPAEYGAILLEAILRREALDRELAPVREAYRQSGLSDDELAEELERAKHDMRAEQSRKAS